MVDSYGGVYPEDVKEIVGLVRSKVKCSLGFHGHNNLELALTNTLTAISCGIEYIDSTILGMGRGAGNLKTELLLTVLNNRLNLEVNFNALEKAVSAILPLLKKYEWGTNLPYMISGSNSLPQKDVMEWVTTRFYSFNSIIRALENQRYHKEDNEKFPIAKFDTSDKVLIVGGGPSVADNIQGIISFLEINSDTAIVHASSKNAAYFKHLNNKQYFCLVGNEGYRLELVLDDLANFNGNCILPPYPRKMGTYVPDSVYNKTFELEEIDFVNKLQDAHTTIALQIVCNLRAKQVYLVGYDGYSNGDISKKELQLINENEFLFDIAKKYFVDFQSLTFTNYSVPNTNNLFYLLSK
jgi:4-hydroxy 2-oxovalerate aldolase